MRLQKQALYMRNSTKPIAEDKEDLTNLVKEYIRALVWNIVERLGLYWSVDDDDNKECRFDVSDITNKTFRYSVKNETSYDIVKLEELKLTDTKEVYLVNELDPDEEDTLEDLNLEELFNLAILLEDAYNKA